MAMFNFILLPVVDHTCMSCVIVFVYGWATMKFGHQNSTLLRFRLSIIIMNDTANHRQQWWRCGKKKKCFFQYQNVNGLWANLFSGRDPSLIGHHHLIFVVCENSWNNKKKHQWKACDKIICDQRKMFFAAYWILTIK